MNLFIDSSAYIAFYNKRDKNHDKALSFINKIKNKELGPVIFYTSDYIFDETVTTILALTKNKKYATKIGESIRNSKITRIIKINDEIFDEAWKLFKTYRDKLWSFTDCTSFIIMKKINIKTAFSFDKHYKQAGYEIMP